MKLKRNSPFKYFGAKHSQIQHFPPPKYKTIVEPFAGSFAYSWAYYQLVDKIILYELDEKVVAIYDLLFNRTEQFYAYPIPKNQAEYDAIGDVGYRNWVSSFFSFSGFDMGANKFPGQDTICFQCYFAEPNNKKMVNKKGVELRDNVGVTYIGSTKYNLYAKLLDIKSRCQVEFHHKDAMQELPNLTEEATYFIDPPYKNKNGEMYGQANNVDFDTLADYCLNKLKGQIIVTEQDTADWLPFKPIKRVRSSATKLNTTKYHTLVAYIR